MSYDNTCKYLAEQYPGEFARWLLGVDSQVVTILKTELILEPIRIYNHIIIRYPLMLVDNREG